MISWLWCRIRSSGATRICYHNLCYELHTKKNSTRGCIPTKESIRIQSAPIPFSRRTIMFPTQSNWMHQASDTNRRSQRESQRAHTQTEKKWQKKIGYIARMKSQSLRMHFACAVALCTGEIRQNCFTNQTGVKSLSFGIRCERVKWNLSAVSSGFCLGRYCLISAVELCIVSVLYYTRNASMR